MPLVEQELLTLPDHLSSPPVCSGVRVARSVVFCVVFCRSLFVLLSFFFWPLCCLSFDLQILITPLVSFQNIPPCPFSTLLYWKSITTLHIKVNGPCVIASLTIWMNEYVLDFLYRDLTYIVTIFVSNGTISCFSCFILFYLYVCVCVSS